MNFIPVDYIPMRASVKPNIKSEYKPLRSYLNEFMNMRVKRARVVMTSNEYTDLNSAKASIYVAIKRHALPIKIHIRGEYLYFVRTDLEG